MRPAAVAAAQVDALTLEVQERMGVAPGRGRHHSHGAAPAAAASGDGAAGAGAGAGTAKLVQWVGADVDPYWDRWYAAPEAWAGFNKGDPTLVQLDRRVEELRVQLTAKGLDVDARELEL